MVVTPSSVAAYRDPCDPSSTVPLLPLPPSTFKGQPSIQYPSQRQSLLQGGAAVKLPVHSSSQPSATPVTAPAGNAGSHSKVVNSNNKTVRPGANVKSLSTQERMSLFMEHTVAINNKSTPRVVIRKDAKFKSACNKIRWLNKSSETVTSKAIASVGQDKNSTAPGGIEKTTIDESNTQYYSFHEKADPSLDELVNPPIKLPSALLVREQHPHYTSHTIHTIYGKTFSGKFSWL